MTPRFRYFAALMTLGLAGCSAGQVTQPPDFASQAAPVAVPVRLDFTGCPPSLQPSWVAYRDGSGPWTVVPGTTLFTFSIASNRGVLALVTHPSSPRLTVHQPKFLYFTKAELTRLTTSTTGILGNCPTVPVSKTLNVPLANIGTDNVMASLGLNGVGFASAGDTVLALQNVTDASGDFFASLSRPQDGVPTRYVVERTVDVTSIPSGGYLPFAADFQGPGSFAPDGGRATVRGYLGEPNAGHALYLSDCRQSFYSLNQTYSVPPVGGGFSIYGIPRSKRRANEKHFVSFLAGDDTTFRADGRVYDPARSPSVVLPAKVSGLAMTEEGGGYLRLRFNYRVPYPRSAPFIQYVSPSGQNPVSLVVLLATPEYADGNVDLAPPDLSSLPGWDNTWLPPAGSDVSFYVDNLSDNLLFGLTAICAERIQSARFGRWIAGSITINRHTAPAASAGGSDAHLPFLPPPALWAAGQGPEVDGMVVARTPRRWR